jgi:hypothetical protein
MRLTIVIVSDDFSQVLIEPVKIRVYPAGPDDQTGGCIKALSDKSYGK